MKPSALNVSSASKAPMLAGHIAWDWGSRWSRFGELLGRLNATPKKLDELHHSTPDCRAMPWGSARVGRNGRTSGNAIRTCLQRAGLRLNTTVVQVDERHEVSKSATNTNPYALNPMHSSASMGAGADRPTSGTLLACGEMEVSVRTLRSRPVIGLDSSGSRSSTVVLQAYRRV